MPGLPPPDELPKTRGGEPGVERVEVRVADLDDRAGGEHRAVVVAGHADGGSRSERLDQPGGAHELSHLLEKLIKLGVGDRVGERDDHRLLYHEPIQSWTGVEVEGRFVLKR